MTARERMVRVVAEALDRGTGLAFTDAIAVVAALEAEMGLREERDMHDSADDTFPIARLVTDWIGDGDE